MSQPPPPAAATPPYWAQACRELAQRDRVLRRLIARYGNAQLQSHGDAFITLARSIIGQQISVKAAQSVWERFAALMAPVSPQAVLALPPATMRQAGLSERKVQYLRDLAQHSADGRLRPHAWAEMDDEAITAELMRVRGIGRWTADMFLIFHLMRPNILPLDDLGLARGISLNYFSAEPVSRSDLRELATAWAPWRSVATWYIWRSLDPLPVAY